MAAYLFSILAASAAGHAEASESLSDAATDSVAEFHAPLIVPRHTELTDEDVYLPFTIDIVEQEKVSIERNASYMGAVGCESHCGGDFTHAVDAAAAPDTTGRQLSWLAAYKFRVIITLLQSLDTLHIGIAQHVLAVGEHFYGLAAKFLKCQFQAHVAQAADPHGNRLHGF